MDEDLLDAAREKLGRWSREGSEAGEKVNWLRLEVDLQRGKLPSLDPRRVLQLEKPASDTCRLFFCRGLPLKSLSLRKPRS